MNRFDDWYERRRTPRSRRKEVAARIILATLGVLTCALATSDAAPAPFTHTMVQVGGPAALISMVLMGLLGAALLTETVVNDMLPPRFSLDWGRRHRQSMWMALGLIFELFAYQVFTVGLSVSWGGYLVVYGLGSIALAFIDAAGERALDRRRWET